jgi:ribosomal protein S18 acetylase RimI-like enzyme
MRAFRIEPLSEGDRGWVRSLLREHWGDARVVSRGRVHQADQLPGFVATQENQPVGLVTYRVEGDACEIVSLDSLVEGSGIGSALIEAVKEAASAAGCRRLWLITTNDNAHALRFYQRRGFVLAALHRNALERSRELKPEIPLIGMDGIPLWDEIELEMILK